MQLRPQLRQKPVKSGVCFWCSRRAHVAPAGKSERSPTSKTFEERQKIHVDNNFFRGILCGSSIVSVDRAGLTAYSARFEELSMSATSENVAKNWVLVLTSAASFMVALDALVVTTALTTIRLDLSASVEALEWTVNAYGLTFAALLLMGAALGDRFGRRRMFMAGLALF